MSSRLGITWATGGEWVSRPTISTPPTPSRLRRHCFAGKDYRFGLSCPQTWPIAAPVRFTCLGTFVAERFDVVRQWCFGKILLRRRHVRFVDCGHRFLRRRQQTSRRGCSFGVGTTSASLERPAAAVSGPPSPASSPGVLMGSPHGGGSPRSTPAKRANTWGGSRNTGRTGSRDARAIGACRRAKTPDRLSSSVRSCRHNRRRCKAATSRCQVPERF